VVLQYASNHFTVSQSTPAQPLHLFGCFVIKIYVWLRDLYVEKVEKWYVFEIQLIGLIKKLDKKTKIAPENVQVNTT